MERTVNLNVSKKKYIIPLTIINKIPQISNIIKDTNFNINKTIFIYRSSLVFNHVLAFVIDEKHPFPVEYYYELDYFDINYDINKLYNPYKILSERIDVLENKINKDISTINNKLNIINNITLNTHLSHKKEDFVCQKNCGNTRKYRSVYCKFCNTDKCLNCDIITPNKYCDNHLKSRHNLSFCNDKLCPNRRMEGKKCVGNTCVGNTFKKNYIKEII